MIDDRKHRRLIDCSISMMAFWPALLMWNDGCKVLLNGIIRLFTFFKKIFLHILFDFIV